MAKRCCTPFMDKFITEYNFQVDAGNIFSAAEPLQSNNTADTLRTLI